MRGTGQYNAGFYLSVMSLKKNNEDNKTLFLEISDMIKRLK